MERLGLILASFSAFLTSINYIITDKAGLYHKPNYSIMDHAIHAIIVIPYIFRIRNEIEISSLFWKLIFCAGLFFSVGTALNTYGFYLLPFADELFITFNDTIVVALLAWCFLKEVLHFYDALTLSIDIFGIILISAPTLIFLQHGDKPMKPFIFQILASLGTCIMMSVAYVITRYIRESPATVIIAAEAIISVFVYMIISAYYGVLHFPTSGNYWILTIIISLMTLVSKLSLIFALKYDYAFRVVMVSTLSLPAVKIFKGLSTNVELKSIEIVGLALMVLSIVLLYVENTLKNVLRNTFGIFISNFNDIQESDRFDEPNEPILNRLFSGGKPPTLYSTD